MGKISAGVYFGCVAAATVAGFGVMMEFRPALAHSVREWVGLEKPPQVRSNSFYAMRVAPLLQEHCTACHGSGREKAELRLDSLAAVLRGSKHGAVIKPGDLEKSELFTRITLPASNDKFMPPDSKPPLSPDEVKVIKLWIAAGASGVQAVNAIKGAPPPVVQVKFTEIDEAAVLRQRAPLSSVVQQLQDRFPGIIAYESRGSADLELNAALMRTSFGDKELAALAPLQDHIVWADFSGTSISDASGAALAAMRHLRTLRLINTQVTDSTIQALTSAKELRSLTLVGTAVTEQCVAALRKTKIRVIR